MIWLSTLLMLASFAAAALVVWAAPLLLNPLGLGEFIFVGQICLVILTLSVLDIAFTRLPGSSKDHGTGLENNPGS